MFLEKEVKRQPLGGMFTAYYSNGQNRFYHTLYYSNPLIFYLVLFLFCFLPSGEKRLAAARKGMIFCRRFRQHLGTNHTVNGVYSLAL